MSNRLLLAVFALLGLCDCSADRPAAVVAGPAGGIQIRAAFVPSRDDQVIEIDAQDRLAITGAILIMPNGSTIAAESIDAVPNPSESTDRGVNPTDALLGAGFERPFSGAMTETTTIIGESSSTAHIRILEPADYAAAWQGARIEVSFGRGDAAYKQSVPAPPPP